MTNNTTNKKTSGMDIKVRLSTLWIFVLFNMVYADILSLMDPSSPIVQRMTGAQTITQEFLFVGAILMETAIAMALLSRVLKYRANRWANIIAGAVNIVAVVTGGTTHLYYLFFATIEVVCLLLIIWFSWKWSSTESEERSTATS
jgi:hypothetical protein